MIKMYFKGERVKFSGRAEILHGGKFYHATYLEGHEKGKNIVISENYINKFCEVETAYQLKQAERIV